VTALRIPDRWSEVSAQWMTAALSGRFPGAEVAAVTLQWASDGTSRRARFGLRYGSGREGRTGRAAFPLRLRAAGSMCPLQ
jgi:hypothetical protein